jgi:hypothetical protein
MTLAHVAGLPLEELLSLAPGAGALWLALRVRAARSGPREGQRTTPWRR